MRGTERRDWFVVDCGTMEGKALVKHYHAQLVEEGIHSLKVTHTFNLIQQTVPQNQNLPSIVLTASPSQESQNIVTTLESLPSQPTIPG